MGPSLLRCRLSRLDVVATLWGLVMVLLFATSCTDSAVDELQPVSIPLGDVAALAQLSSGDVLAGDRLSGTIYQFSLIDPAPVAIARLAVSADGQRGLLGLAVDDADRIYAAWTRPDEQLVVGRITPGADPEAPDDPSPDSGSTAGPDSLSDPSGIDLVWSGFASSSGANGGHLAFLPDGRLVIGVGTLRRSARIDDPEAVNGKMLAIDPAAGPDQEPEVLSSGWKNPFAFVVTDAGELWVADNEPEDGTSERIGRGDQPDAPRLDVTEQLAPAALIELEPDRLGLCSFITGQLHPVSLQGDGVGATQPGPTLLDRCRAAALVIDDDWILTADLETLHLQPHPTG